MYMVCFHDEEEERDIGPVSTSEECERRLEEKGYQFSHSTPDPGAGEDVTVQIWKREVKGKELLAQIRQITD